MELSNRFRIGYWVFLLGIATAYLIYRFNPIVSGTAIFIDIVVFFFWIGLLLVPIFQEVSFFGLKLRQQIDSIKSDMRGEIINLRSEIQTISIQSQIKQEVNVTEGSTVVSTTRHEEVAEIPPADAEETELSFGALKVLSTLWKHQKDYYGRELSEGRWSFVVGSTNPHYPEFVIGLADTIQRRLVTTLLSNGQIILTDEGIEFCKAHEDELLPDWNYGSWKALPFLMQNSTNFIGTHRTERGFYSLHYHRDSRVAEAVGPREEGVLAPTPAIVIENVANKNEAKRLLVERLGGGE